MARVLVHYDIADEDFRAQFQKTITSPDFNQQFSLETASVYCAEFNTTPDKLSALIDALRRAASGAPSGTNILMEHPTAYSNRPVLEQTVIA